MLVSLSRNRISVTRQATIVKESDVGTLTTFTTPAQPCSILIELRDSGTGSSLITGTDSSDGVQTETLTFTNSKYAQGIKLFKTVTQVTFTSLSGNRVTIKYRALDGSQVKIQSTIYSCINAQISASRQKWDNGVSGTVQNGNIKIMIPLYCSDSTNKIQAGDLITDLDSNQTYLATGNILDDGVGINRFQIVYAERRERT